MDIYDILVAKALSGSGGGGEPVIEALSVTENGTYTAPSGIDGYSPVTVNVSGGGGNEDFADLIDRVIVTANVPEGVTKIGHSAFRNCTQLTSVTVPTTVSIIEAYAFYGCTQLREITLYRQSVVQLTASTALTNVPADCAIFVPSNFVNSYKSASNWSTRADYIQAIQ